MATSNKFLNLKDLIEKNDGIRNFNIYSNYCYDSAVPFDETQQTRLKITSHKNDINEISKSFINFEFEATVQIDTDIIGADSNTAWYLTKIIDSEGQEKIKRVDIEMSPKISFFIGWKNASEIFKTLQIENLNIDTNYYQRNCAQEGFYFNTIKSNEYKVKNKYSHSIYTKARAHSPEVCGGYLDIDAGQDLAKNTPYKVKFNVVLPISDIPCLEYFPDFPSTCGDLVLKFTLNKDSMVYTQVDPVENWERSTFPLCDFKLDQRIDSKYENLRYERIFKQIGCYIETMENLKDIDFGYYITLDVLNLKCTKCSCDVYGFNISTKSKEKIYNIFNETQYFPARHLEVIDFSDNNSYSSSYLSFDIAQPIHNVSKFVFVEVEKGCLTCYNNNNNCDIQFICDGIRYPNKPLDNTIDSRFYSIMIRSGDQNNFFEVDHSYKNTLLDYKKEVTDQTSFFTTFQAKRNGNGHFFDSVDKDKDKVNIQIKYYKNDILEYKSQMWFIRDTYWSFNNQEGLKYHVYGSPPNS